MSSSYVRSTIKSYFTTTFPSKVLVDFTAEERDMVEILRQYSLTRTSQWYGIQFIGSDEEPVSSTSTSTRGQYRETGSLFFHIIVPSGVNAATNIIANVETIRDAFRGRRISDIVIQSVTPVNTEEGSTLQFESGFTSGSFIVNYYYDKFF